MADVWISRKRWTCKYCNVTINDDIPSRRHHESGMRHKNNVDRALRALHRENDDKRRADAETQRAMRQIESAALKDHRRHDGGRGSSAAAAAPPPLHAARAAPAAAPRGAAAPRSTDPWTSYSTAESLGYTGEAPEAWQSKVRLRPAAADVGAWETISSAPVAAAAPPPAAKRAADDARPPPPPLVERTCADNDEDEDDTPIIVTKRPRPTPAAERDVYVKTEASIKLEDAGTCADDGPAPQDAGDARQREGDGARVKSEDAATTTAPEDAPVFRRRKGRGGTARA